MLVLSPLVSRFDVPNARTFIALAYGALLLATAIAAGVVTVRYRPRRPDAGPATLVPPDDGPGIANLLCNDLEVDDDAAVASVLELARLGVIEIATFGNDREVVFVRRPDRVPKDPVLRMVFDFIASQPRLDDGLPIEALRDAHAGTDDGHGAWWAKFRRHVVSDAMERKLVARRFPARLVTGLQSLCGAVVVLAMITVTPKEDSPPGSGATGMSIAVLIGSTCIAMFALSRLDTDALRYTPAGRDLAGRWIGFRDEAERSVTVVEARPSAVTVLGEALVAAAAVGAARETEVRLQLAVGNGSAVWWVDRERWHHTKVRYPGGSNGQSPWWMIRRGLVPLVQFGVVAGVIGFVASRVWQAVDDNQRGDLHRAVTDWIADHSSIDAIRADPTAIGTAIGAFVVLAIGIVFGAVLIGAVTSLLRGLIDLVARRTEHGRLIMHRGEWIAIARPGDDEVRAYRVIDRARLASARRGEMVEVRSTRWLRHVREIT